MREKEGERELGSDLGSERVYQPTHPPLSPRWLRPFKNSLTSTLPDPSVSSVLKMFCIFVPLPGVVRRNSSSTAQRLVLAAFAASSAPSKASHLGGGSEYGKV